MAESPLRVVVWSTGSIGSIVIPAIQRRPGLSSWAYAIRKSKAGRDAGELANGEPIGCAATNDADALVALHPDCIVYTAGARDSAAVEDYDRFRVPASTWCPRRRSAPSTPRPTGRSRVTRSSLPPRRVAPPSTHRASSPGFAADQLPILLTTQSISVTSVHSYEIVCTMTTD